MQAVLEKIKARDVNGLTDDLVKASQEAPLSLLKIQFGAIEGRGDGAVSPISCGSTFITMMQAADLREGNYVIACAG